MWRKDEARAPSLPAQKATQAAAMQSQTPLSNQADAKPTSLTPAQEGRVTRSLVIEGEITGHDDLFIDGEVRGKIRLDGAKLTIGPAGRVTAQVEAHEVVVRGEITGTLTGHDRVQIASTGKARGELITNSIAIEEGAELHVRVNPERKDERTASVPAGAFGAKPDSVTLPLAEKVSQVHV
ncbi:MAG TPA: polymer-forming cytoskeletal protein [Terriglobales bacterium]|nr:polymer-forming cytoskeletal protein [Terriglobales bacterium]HZR63820.1 polymer-forming cytoskeletal protein [Terriglobales bacterium]